jgi:hypothetical protein
MRASVPKVLETQSWPQTIGEVVSEAQASGWSSEEIERLWRAHALMARLFSGRYRGSGRPFINHLAGTAALALRHGGDVTEVFAAYAHAAYAQGEFGRARPGASKANREELRGAVGDEPEGIIAGSDDFDWEGITARRDADEARALSSRDKRLLFLHIVNELDDSLDCGVYGAEWCQGCLSRLAAGADFANALGLETLAEQLNARVRHVRSSGAASGKAVRAKRSETILNPSTKSDKILRLRRRVLQVWDRLVRRWLTRR